jgi:hypothetical protein
LAAATLFFGIAQADRNDDSKLAKFAGHLQSEVPSGPPVINAILSSIHLFRLVLSLSSEEGFMGSVSLHVIGRRHTKDVEGKMGPCGISG